MGPLPNSAGAPRSPRAAREATLNLGARLGVGLLLALAARALPAEQPAPSEPPELVPGTVLEGSLKPGDVHAYRVAVRAGQYLRVFVDQRGVDVAVTLRGPDGTVLADRTAASDHWGPEAASVVAAETGMLRLELQSNEGTSGPYAVRIDALRDPRPSDLTRMQAERLSSEAWALRNKGTKEALGEAWVRCEEALGLWRSLGDTFDEALTGHVMAILQLQRGEIRAAAERLEQLLEVWRQLGDVYRQAVTLQNRGVALEALGERPKALESFSEALRLFQQAQDPKGEGAVLNSLGRMHDVLGDKEKALEFYARALPLRRQTGDRIGLGATLNNLGLVYAALGEARKALGYYQEASALWKELGERRGQGMTLNNLGMAHLRLGETAAAQRAFEAALLVAREGGNREAEALSLHNIGGVHASAGRHDRALELFAQALGLWRALEDRPHEAFTLVNLGVARARLGHGEEAQTDLAMALDLSRAVHSPTVEARALVGLAEIERARGLLSEAQAHLEQSLSIVESMRARTGGDELRTSYFATVRPQYEAYIDVLMERHRIDPRAGFDIRALEASERARARGLLDLLAEAAIDVRRGVDPELKARETGLKTRLSALQSRLVRAYAARTPDPARTAALEAELEKTWSEQEALQQEIRRRNPAYGTLRYPVPPTAEGIRGLLDEGTVLLEYALGSGASYLFVVTRGGISSHRLPPEAELADLVAALQERLRAGPARRVGAFAQPALRLYEVLLAPAARSLEGKGRLLIVPDGILHRLPFEALLTESPRAGADFPTLSYVLRRFEVAYVPSAGVLASLYRESGARAEGSSMPAPEPSPRAAPTAKARPAFLAFADPVFGTAETGRAKARGIEDPEDLVRSALVRDGGLRLPRLQGSGREVDAIAGLLPRGRAALYLREKATEESVKGSGGARWLHFATHALVSESEPRSSSLVLTLDEDPSEDGLLQVHEVFNLELRSDLVVLSACETGLGRGVRGEGLVGLARAFFYAGASSLVVSLWQVHDRSTADLMVRFYRHLFGGKDKAVALREAKLALLADPRRAHPYHWAPFVLLGLPR